MTKTKTRRSADVQNGSDKQSKKQAKREARLMLKLEQARKKIQKAEQKVAKARSKLEANEQLVQDIELQLAELRGIQVEIPGKHDAQPETQGENNGKFDLIAPSVQETSQQPPEESEANARTALQNEPAPQAEAVDNEDRIELITPPEQETARQEAEQQTGVESSLQETEVDSGDRFDLATSPTQEASLPPSEGRADVPAPQDEQTPSSVQEHVADTEQNAAIPVTEETAAVPAESEHTHEGQS
jgi:hypothetical protein